MDRSKYDKAMLILQALHKKVIEAAERVEFNKAIQEEKKAV